MIKLRLIVVLLLFSGGLMAQEKLDLQKSRTLALEHNQKIKAAKANSLSSEAGKKAMFTNFLPNLKFDGQISHVGDVQAMDIPSLPVLNGDGNPSGLWSLPIYKEMTGENIYKLNMGLTQPLYMGGKIRNAYKATKLGESIAKSNVVYETSEMIYKTDQQYWLVVSLKEKQQLAIQFKKLVSDLVRDLENMHESELITWNEVLKAKVKYNEADLQLLKASNGVVLAKMALNQVIGLDLNTPIKVQDSVLSEDVKLKEMNFQELAMRQRAEIKMLEDKVELNRTQVKMTNADFMPQLAVGANYYYQNPTHLSEDKGEFTWNVGASLSVPVFHWNERKHKVKQQKYKQDAAQLELEEAKEMVSLEAQQAYFRLNEAMTKIKMTESSLEQAEENLKLTRDQFNEGLVTTTDVLDAQVFWEKAYSEFIDAKIEYKINDSAFQKAIGDLK
ncbi:MAG: TolC family protein [Marinifilaceae bacterium]